MKRVFLAGTTTGTTWRKEMTERLIARGVLPDQIINPHLPPGVHWTKAHQQAEQDCQDDPETIVFIHICPAAREDGEPGYAHTIAKSEMLGPTSMYEIGEFANAATNRTAIVLDIESFTPNKRPRNVLENIAARLTNKYGTQPYFPTFAEAEDWIVSQLSSQ